MLTSWPGYRIEVFVYQGSAAEYVCQTRLREAPNKAGCSAVYKNHREGTTERSEARGRQGHRYNPDRAELVPGGHCAHLQQLKTEHVTAMLVPEGSPRPCISGDALAQEGLSSVSGEP